MRKVILQMTISIDGVANVGGQDPEDPELQAMKLGWLGQAGCHIMGRTTYEEMRQHWPYSDHAYAAPMNELPKVVFSRTLTEATWETSRIASASPAETSWPAPRFTSTRTRAAATPSDRPRPRPRYRPGRPPPV